MPCCDGDKPCGGPAYHVDPDDAAYAEARSRYPTVKPDHGAWAAAENGQDQFRDYDDGLLAEDDPEPFEYTGQHLSACNFPLGSFGTGRVLLCGDGTLKEWTVVNQVRGDDGGPGDAPQPLNDMPCNFFAVSATPQGGKKQTFALVTPQNYTDANVALPPRREAHVSQHEVRRLQTMPGIKSLSMVCRYPIADTTYEIPGLPVQVSMEALSPAIPGDSKASCIPVAIFQFTLKNTGTVPCEVSLMEAQQNFIGWDGKLDCTAGATKLWGGNVNTPYMSADKSLAGLKMSSNTVKPDTPDIAGTLCVSAVVTTGSKVTVISQAADEEDLFAQFSSGKFQSPTTAATPPSAAGKSWCGGVVQTVTVAGGATTTVDFYLSWHFPNRSRGGSCGRGRQTILPDIIGNYYDNLFSSAEAVAEGVHKQIDYLRGTTRQYTNAVFGSTVPPDLLDSAAGRLAVARSATMWWNKSGIVLGCEGNGCCPLNCTHVYGYTTLLERLYPDLAEDMCVSNFVRNFDPATGATMRYGEGGWAIDGALACVIKAYLCVRQADSKATWLPKVWPNIKAQMEIIFTKFDDGTGVIRVAQQNTYDTAMFGPNTFIGSYWVTALKASAEMATLMKDDATAKKYSGRAALSATNYEKLCWKEEFGYYIAVVNASNCANSYGPGCFVDQLCCIGLSSACGFGHIFNPAHEISARKAIQKYNQVTQTSTKGYVDMQHHFFPGDTGVTVCNYPNGKLKNGMRYENLVSSGFTSPVIAGMVLDRNMKGALEIAGNLRQRHDGRHRSPWNEPECGLLYSRAMAHWNIFDQACGHIYCSQTGALSFDPRSDVAVSGGARMFKCFYTVEGGWGEFSQQGPAGLPSGKLTLSCIWGAGVELKTLGVVSSAKTATATVGGKSQAVSIAAGVITFTGGLTLAKGQSLTVTLGGGDYELNMAATAAICDGTLRQRRPAWTGASRDEDDDSAGASCCVPGSACCPGGVCGPDGSCFMPSEGGKAATQQQQPLSQISGITMAVGAFLMFLLGSLLGPKLQALLELVFRPAA